MSIKMSREKINTIIELPERVITSNGVMFHIQSWDPSVNRSGVSVLCRLIPVEDKPNPELSKK